MRQRRASTRCNCGCGRHPFDCQTFLRRRAMHGGRANGEKKRMKIPGKVRGMTPLEAYRAGYRSGYVTASDRARRRHARQEPSA